MDGWMNRGDVQQLRSEADERHKSSACTRVLTSEFWRKFVLSRSDTNVNSVFHQQQPRHCGTRQPQMSP